MGFLAKLGQREWAGLLQENFFRGWSRKTGYHANGFQKQEGQEHLERGWSRKTGQQANGIHGQEHLERGWSKKTGHEENVKEIQASDVEKADSPKKIVDAVLSGIGVANFAVNDRA